MVVTLVVAALFHHRRKRPKKTLTQPPPASLQQLTTKNAPSAGNEEMATPAGQNENIYSMEVNAGYDVPVITPSHLVPLSVEAGRQEVSQRQDIALSPNRAYGSTGSIPVDEVDRTVPDVSGSYHYYENPLL